MVLFKLPIFGNLARKLIFEQRLKSEVIFRQCSNHVLSVEKQIINKPTESVSAVNNKEKAVFTSEPIVLNLARVNPEYDIKEQDDQIDSLFEIHREDFYLDESLHGFTPKLPKALDPSLEDLSDLATNPIPSFNIASLADENHTIQELVKLGVQLWKFDVKLPVLKTLIRLDFKKDVKPYIQFLHDCGVKADQLGDFITKNPLIFTVNLDDLRTRIRYLRVHKFQPDAIAMIITKNPFWLLLSTKKIDTRLGYFQHNFKLNGRQVRQLAVKLPKLITYKMQSLEDKTFAIHKEMGFDLQHMQLMLMNSPRLWTKCRKNLVQTFDYAHNTMKLSHEIIANQPHILQCRRKRLEARHKFLMQIKKVQYDPSKPMYISPKALISGSDGEFCKNVAHASIITYNMFLKTL